MPVHLLSCIGCAECKLEINPAGFGDEENRCLTFLYGAGARSFDAGHFGGKGIFEGSIMR
jgi:hypothetical protein